MQTQEITIRVDSEAAGVYLAASEEDSRKLDCDAALLSESLEQVMRDIGTRAQQRGLTPEIAESILRDE